MSARFEIVRTDGRGDDKTQPWHARFVAANGRIVWTTETYSRRGAALNAIASFVEPQYAGWLDRWWYDDRKAMGDAIVYRADSWNKKNGLLIEIRDVDERATP